MFSDVKTPEYSVSLTSSAENDLKDLADYYYDCAGKESSERFEIAAETMIGSLGTWPRANQMWDDDDRIRKVNFPNHKVSIIYYIDDEELEVIAFIAFHQERKPEYIRRIISERSQTSK